MRTSHTRSVLEEYKPPVAGNGSFSNGSRQPSAGRPREKTVLPDFPRRDDNVGPRQGSIPAGAYSGSSYVAGVPSVTQYSSEHQRPAGSTTGAYASSGSAGRSSSVPRPTSRSTAPAATAPGATGHTSVATASGTAARGAARSVVPGSILDSLRQPSVVPNAISTLAQRMGNSGWDYSSLAGGTTASSLRLKRQAGAAADPGSPAGMPSSPACHVQHPQQLNPHGPAEPLRAMYVSGPLAGTSGAPGASAAATSGLGAAGPGRRTSTERVLSRAGSFSAGSPQAPSTSYAQDAGPPPQQQRISVAGGAVYASQYAPQHGNAASTVFIPYSSQHSGSGAVAYSAVGGGAPGGTSAAGAPGSTYYPAASSPHQRPPGLSLGAVIGAGAAGAGALQSPSATGTPALQPLLSATSPHGPAVTSHAALAGEGSPRSVHRTLSSSSLTRSGSGNGSAGGLGSGAAAAAVPSALPTAGGGSRLRAVGTAATGVGDDGTGSTDNASNASLRRLQLQQEELSYRRSGNGVAGPTAAGGSAAAAARAMSPKSAALYSATPSAAKAHAGSDPYHAHPQPQQPHYSALPAGAALDAGGSSYTSTASAYSTASSNSSSNSSSNGGSGGGSGTSSKSSVAVAGGTGVSSVSSSRTTSSISARSAADAVHSAASSHHHHHHHGSHPPPPPQQQQHQAAGAAQRGGVEAERAQAGAVGRTGSLHSQPGGGAAGEKRQASSGTHSSVASVGDDSSARSAGALDAGPPVCGPLADLPVVAAAPRDTQPGRGCVGLQNLGNTCFMNSILQSLNAVPELVQQFLASSDRHCWSSRAVVAPAYSALVRDMMAGSPGGCVNPSSFMRKVAKHDSRWGDGRQQDSQEFLNSLLEVLQSECNRITCKPTYRELQGKGSEEAQAAEAYAYARSWNDSIVDDIFGGLTQSTIQCHACKRLSHTFEPFLGLALPIPGAGSGGAAAEVTVADCLRAFVECEELAGDDSYKCEACKRRQPHSKRLQIFRPPRVLVLTLKRFSQRPAAPGFLSRFRSPAKNNTPVRLEPEPLDLSPYCNPLGLRGLAVQGRGPVAPVYQLVAVSHHSGSLDGGHYTAQARSCLDGQWYNFNDSSVRREAGRPGGASSSAYVLFYRMATLPSSSL